MEKYKSRTKNERIELFKEFMGDIIQKNFMVYLEKEGFFDAPASRRFHGAYDGGLFDHSLIVAETLIEFTKNNDLKWELSRSAYIIGMFHDICKMDAFSKSKFLNDSLYYEFNNEVLLTGHAEKSVMLLSQFFRLTEEEIVCIRYHMGVHQSDTWEQYSRALAKHPNLLWTNHADVYASKILRI